MVKTRGLRAGDLVQVRSEEEILATLDANGTLDDLPFMPEMKAWCGRRFRVTSRADKTCDTVEGRGQRRMYNTVHLSGLRCDGSAHGGCMAGCLTFWKEAWLVAVPEASTPSRGPDAKGGATTGPRPIPVSVSVSGRAGCTAAQLDAATRRSGEVYSCQATRLLEASQRLRWFDPRQYVREVRSGNVRPLDAVRQTLVFLFNNFQNLQRRFLPERLRLQGGSWYPFVRGRLTKTPRETLDLVAGEVVEVKSKAEIVATLDRTGRNRGLIFDMEMVPFCGRRLRVLRRVEKIIDERTGKMLTFGSDAVILEGGVCEGRFHGMCPRLTYSYWREIWLRRVEPTPCEAPAGVIQAAPKAAGTSDVMATATRPTA
jgi:hypothetical protein